MEICDDNHEQIVYQPERTYAGTMRGCPFCRAMRDNEKATEYLKERISELEKDVANAK